MSVCLGPKLFAQPFSVQHIYHHLPFGALLLLVAVGVLPSNLDTRQLTSEDEDEDPHMITEKRKRVGNFRPAIWRPEAAHHVSFILFR